MSDTIVRDCIICEEETDCIQGICEDCRNGYGWKVEFIERYRNPDGTVSGIAGEMIAFIEKDIIDPLITRGDGCEYCAWKIEPIGVSQWEKVGKKFGYWKYFESQAKEEMRKGIIEWAEKQRDVIFEGVEYQKNPPLAAQSLLDDLINYLK